MSATFGRRSVVARIDTGGNLSSPESARGAALFAPAEEKYERLAPIGSGGMGEVILVHDRDLRRDVAMKLLRDDYADLAPMKRKFVAEAQATSQLEHPGIPPVHDIGLTPGGNVYFTMKVVRGDTLAAVLKKLVLGAKEVRRIHTLHRLVSALERICEACHFAHEKGVIHRDLKPENVMLGEYGEVHVVDWGIAKVLSSSSDADTDRESDLVDTGEVEAATMTQVGTVKGTIPYMSPEQARGEPLDRRTDVWSLGAILYEILTLRAAFEGSGPEMLVRVRDADFPPVETRHARRPVPQALAAVCRKAMSKDASARHATAREFGEELREWLDGRAEKDRRHGEAEALAAQGREATSRYDRLRDAAQAAGREVQAETIACEPWRPRAEKRTLADARRKLMRARRETALAFAEATRLLEGALLAEPENASARGALADLWKDRLAEAEDRNAADEAAHALTMVRRYDDGRLASLVSGQGSIELASDPPGAEVTLHRFEDDDGVLTPDAGRVLGRTPMAPTPLAMGSYLAVLRLPGFPDVRYPVHVTRNRRWRGTVKLRTASEIGDGFVYVPGGPFVYGDGKDAKFLELPDFAVAAKPVTFGDWAEYLAAVEKEEGLEAAQKRVPRVRGDGDYMGRRQDGSWHALPVNCEGPARDRCLREHGPDFDALLPVAGVSWHDAAAYCAWKTRTTGREWRLPTEEEREKAARGVDGRQFPWGDLADATLGKCRDSRQEPTQPEPVGSFPDAVSVYGMIDASGNSFDWTDSWFDARRAARAARGGAWNNPIGSLRCAMRNLNEPGFRDASFGLRCARSLSGN